MFPSVGVKAIVWTLLFISSLKINEPILVISNWFRTTTTTKATTKATTTVEATTTKPLQDNYNGESKFHNTALAKMFFKVFKQHSKYNLVLNLPDCYYYLFD